MTSVYLVMRGTEVVTTVNSIIEARQTVRHMLHSIRLGRANSIERIAIMKVGIRINDAGFLAFEKLDWVEM